MLSHNRKKLPKFFTNDDFINNDFINKKTFEFIEFIKNINRSQYKNLNFKTILSQKLSIFFRKVC